MGWRVIALGTLTACGRISFDPPEAFELNVHGDHACALAEDGRLWCWGSNEYGQLGEGAGAVELSPHRVLNTPPFERVDVGEYNTFASTADGELWAWGANGFGQAGIGVVTTAERMPRPIAANVERAAVSQVFTCALHRDGTVSCWGANTCGELGNGTQVPHSAPQLVPGLSGVASLGVHDRFACVLDSAGAMSCWGTPFSSCSTPMPPTPITLPKLKQVEGGCHITLCALEEVGRVWCLGENDYGQLGNGTMAGSGMFVPVDFGADPPRITEIAVGSYHVCARTADHRVWCWGHNVNGSVGIGDASGQNQLRPQQLPFFDGSIPIDNLESGCGPSCVRSGLDVYCWGDNRFGAHGDGTTGVRFEPVKVRLDLR